jgi:hypothetical protein
MRINFFRNLQQLYARYKEYVRVDLIMYGVLLLAIIIYFLVSTLI